MSSDRLDVTGCISYMPLIVTVKTIAECLRTDCNILGDKKRINVNNIKVSSCYYMVMLLDGSSCQ